MHICHLQCDTPQIRSRVLHELTGEKLLTNGNTLSTGSSLTLKPSTNLSEEKSNLSSDSDFEDKSAVIRKRKISNSLKCEGDDNIVVIHMITVLILKISQKSSQTFLHPSPSIGNNFLLIFSLYYHMMKNIHTLSNHTRSMKLDHLKVLQNLLLVQ